MSHPRHSIVAGVVAAILLPAIGHAFEISYSPLTGRLNVGTIDTELVLDSVFAPTGALRILGTESGLAGGQWLVVPMPYFRGRALDNLEVCISTSGSSVTRINATVVVDVTLPGSEVTLADDPTDRTGTLCYDVPLGGVEPVGGLSLLLDVWINDEYDHIEISSITLSTRR